MSIVRPPDCCYIYYDGKTELYISEEKAKKIVVSFKPTSDEKGIEVLIDAENTYLRLLRLRWNFTASEELSMQNGFESIRVFSEGGGGFISSSFHGIKTTHSASPVSNGETQKSGTARVPPFRLAPLWDKLSRS